MWSLWLLAAFLDRWTLELSPATLEMRYQQQHERLWLPWLVGEKALSFLTTVASLRKAHRLTGSAGVWCFLFTASFALLAALYAGALVLAVVPRCRRRCFQLILWLEVVQTVVRPVYPLCLQQCKAADPDKFARDVLEGHWPSELRLFTVFWLMKLWLRCSYLFKHMVLLSLLNAATLLVLLAFRWPLSTVSIASLRLGIMLLCPALCYRAELRKRLRFLDSLPPHPEPALYRGLVRLKPPQPPAQADAGSSAADPEGSPAYHAAWKAARQSFGGSGGCAAAPATPRLLHMRFGAPEPTALPPDFGGCAVEAAEAVGLRVFDSYVAVGSVWLSLVVDSSDAKETELAALMSKMQQDPRMSFMLLMDVTVQDGKRVWSLRRDTSAGAPSTAPVAVPEIMAVGSLVLPTDVQACLNVGVRLPAQMAAQPPQLFIMLRSMGSCTRLDVPIHRSHGSDSMLQFAHPIQLPSRSRSWPLEVYVMDVGNGTLFSSPWPVVACSESPLLQELQSLESLLSARHAPLPLPSALWALRDLTRLQECVAQLPAGMAEVLRAGETSTPHGVPLQLQQLAERVRASCPALLALAASLGLARLLQLLLRGAVHAFAPSLLGSAATEPSAAVADELLLPLPRRPTSAAGSATSELLRAAGRAGPFTATVLHSIVASGSTSALAVLQDAAAAAGYRLNWRVAIAAPVQAGEAPLQLQSVSAMQLLAQRLPGSRDLGLRVFAPGVPCPPAREWEEAVSTVQLRPEGAAAAAEVSVQACLRESQAETGAWPAWFRWPGDRLLVGVPVAAHRFLPAVVVLALLAAACFALLLLLPSESQPWLPQRAP